MKYKLVSGIKLLLWSKESEWKWSFVEKKWEIEDFETVYKNLKGKYGEDMQMLAGLIKNNWWLITRIFTKIHNLRRI